MGLNNQKQKFLIHEGAVFIITGASSGLGKQLAYIYCKRNLNIIIAGRDQARLLQTKKKCQQIGNSNIITYLGDLTIPQKCKQLVQVAIKNYNKIDVLILNAGVNAHFQFQKINKIQIFERLMKINFYSNVILTQIALPYIKTTKGKFIVISSLSGKFGLPSRSAYCASKFALTGFFQSLRTEQKINITLVYPTSLDTPMRENSLLTTTQASLGNKRQNPKQCAQLIVKKVDKNCEDIYIPLKSFIGICLQPIFPNFIRNKVTNTARL